MHLGIDMGSRTIKFALLNGSEIVDHGVAESGCAPADIARSIHLAVVDRLAGMLERIGCAGQIVFSGGVANNHFIAKALEKKLGAAVFVPPTPTIVGAIGAAIHAEKEE